MRHILCVFALFYVINALGESKLSIENYSGRRPASLRLSGLTRLPFDEGFLKLPPSARNPLHHDVSVAFLPPADETTPIFLFIHGATQDKTSFAESALSLHEQSPASGQAYIDLHGAGETLERYLPLDYEIPFEQNAEAVSAFARQIRQAYPKNPIIMSGVSYGGGVGLKALAQDAGLSKIISKFVVISFDTSVIQLQSEITLRAALREALFPLGKESSQYFIDEVAREIIFTRSMFLEPTLFKAPFPWTLEATFRISQGIRSPDIDALFANLPKDHTHVMLSLDDVYLDVVGAVQRYSRMLPVRSIILANDPVKNVDHKTNESNPDYLVAWLLKIAGLSGPEPEGLFIAHPTKGLAEAVGSSEKIHLLQERSQRSAADLWRKEVLRATVSWQNWPFAFPVTTWTDISLHSYFDKLNWTTDQWFNYWQTLMRGGRGAQLNLSLQDALKIQNLVIDHWMGTLRSMTGNSKTKLERILSDHQRCEETLAGQDDASSPQK
jgi:pimeloyl-ACP methyl ester carboxylesterase